jgi:predicted lipoprotein with Yx(FWY)xxD motif
MAPAAVLALLIGGCGSSTKTTSGSKSLYTGTIRVGTKTVYTRTRTVGTTKETLYIHPNGPVSSANTRHIVTRRLGHLGIVLVDGEGYALYAFVPDNGSSSNACTGACTRTWPPIRLTIEMVIDSSPALEEPLVSTEPDPERHQVGDRVVKFAGRVLHNYVGDTSPGTANGQGVHSYGGHWYMLTPTGKLVTNADKTSP